jgi:hypothetical protein
MTSALFRFAKSDYHKNRNNFIFPQISEYKIDNRFGIDLFLYLCPCFNDNGKYEQSNQSYAGPIAFAGFLPGDSEGER